jgi:L-asparaginase
MRKQIYIAYTGGTIGMKPDPEGGGYRPAPGYLAEQMNTFEELTSHDVPKYVINEYDPLLDSADMAPHHWVGIGEDIVRNYDDYDGFVVLHGTDTMAYTASALAFFLDRGLNKPVVMTGSQIPLCEPRNDARTNLITAMQLAAHPQLGEVCVYFNGRVMRGCRTVKVNATGFDAFDSPNAAPLGRVGVRVHIDRSQLRPTPPPGEAIHCQPLRDSFVGAVRIFPGITGTLMRNVLRTPLDALVLETYGAGTGPTTLNHDFVAALREATARGVIIVATSQCMRGFVDLNEYATGGVLADAGVVSTGDMTTEAALTKLSYLFSVTDDIATITQGMGRNLRGEMTDI